MAPAIVASAKTSDRHGGGFEAGASSSIISEVSAAPGVFYQGANLVKRSLDMGQPILFTSVQYRLADFGFTASKEFEDAGILNLGLEDQRNAMRWVQQNIEKVFFPRKSLRFSDLL